MSLFSKIMGVLLVVGLIITPYTAICEAKDVDITDFEYDYFYSIPLNLKYQELVFDLAEEKELDKEIILGMMWLESEYYQEDLVCKNTNGSKDYGLMQLNSNYMYAFAKEVGYTKEEFKPIDPVMNIKVGIDQFHKHFKYWKDDRGFKEKDAYSYALSSYNRGRGGTKKYGVRWVYVNAVMKRTKQVNKKKIDLKKLRLAYNIISERGIINEKR